MFKRLRKRFKRNEKGQGLVEYGLILALVSVVALGALGGIGDSVSEKFTKVDEILQDPRVVAVGSLVDEGYIPIATVNELDNLRKAEVQTFGKGTKWEGDYTSGLGERYVQVADIDLSGIANFEPIGPNSYYPFKGSFNGGGYTIENLKITRNSDDYIGLFGYTSGSKVENIKLKDVNIEGGVSTGGVAGYIAYSTTISNSQVSGSVTGDRNVGGISGGSLSSTVINTFANADVSGSSTSGGLVGNSQHSSVIKNSHSSGDVVVSSNTAGGLIGHMSGGNGVSQVQGSHATGNVTGGSSVGGLIGNTAKSVEVENSYATGDAMGADSQVGGLVGSNEGSIKKCYATGDVSGYQNLGGLVGFNHRGSLIVNSYASGRVTGERRAGGLVGAQQRGTVENSYAIGGVLLSGSDVGGLVGAQIESSQVIGGYFDIESTGQSSSIAGTGLITSKMKQQDSYSGWDFNSVWEMTNGQYPTLRR